MSFIGRILPASITSFYSGKTVEKPSELNNLEKTARENGSTKAAEIYKELSDLGYKSTDEVSKVLTDLKEPVLALDVDMLHDLFTERNMPANLIYKIAGFNYKTVESVPGLNIFISFDAVKLTNLMLIREQEFNARRQEERYETVYGKGSLNGPTDGLDTLKFRQQTRPIESPINSDKKAA